MTIHSQRGQAFLQKSALRCSHGTPRQHRVLVGSLADALRRAAAMHGQSAAAAGAAERWQFLLPFVALSSRSGETIAGRPGVDVFSFGKCKAGWNNCMTMWKLAGCFFWRWDLPNFHFSHLPAQLLSLPAVSLLKQKKRLKQPHWASTQLKLN